MVEEAKLLTEEPDFKGYIHDVGGPTADFRFPACDKQLTKGACPGRQCLFPEPCRNLKACLLYTSQLAQTNRVIAPEVDTIFLTTNLKYSYLSSSIVKEIAEYDGDISEFLHPAIAARVREKLRDGR